MASDGESCEEDKHALSLPSLPHDLLPEARAGARRGRTELDTRKQLLKHDDSLILARQRLWEKGKVVGHEWKSEDKIDAWLNQTVVAAEDSDRRAPSSEEEEIVMMATANPAGKAVMVARPNGDSARRTKDGTAIRLFGRWAKRLND